MKRWAGIVGLLIFGVLVANACEMTADQRKSWNQGAIQTAKENMANGLPENTVWCMEPTDRNINTTNESTTPYVVSSRVLASANYDCDTVTLFNTDGYYCDATFCYISGYQPLGIIRPNQQPILEAAA